MIVQEKSTWCDQQEKEGCGSCDHWWYVKIFLEIYTINISFLSFETLFGQIHSKTKTFRISDGSVLFISIYNTLIWFLFFAQTTKRVSFDLVELIFYLSSILKPEDSF